MLPHPFFSLLLTFPPFSIIVLTFPFPHLPLSSHSRCSLLFCLCFSAFSPVMCFKSWWKDDFYNQNAWKICGFYAFSRKYCKNISKMFGLQKIFITFADVNSFSIHNNQSRHLWNVCFLITSLSRLYKSCIVTGRWCSVLLFHNCRISFLWLGEEIRFRCTHGVSFSSDSGHEENWTMTPSLHTFFFFLWWDRLYEVAAVTTVCDGHLLSHVHLLYIY